jgi:hypothetical protein
MRILLLQAQQQQQQQTVIEAAVSRNGSSSSGIWVSGCVPKRCMRGSRCYCCCNLNVCSAAQLQQVAVLSGAYGMFREAELVAEASAWAGGMISVSS